MTTWLHENAFIIIGPLWEEFTDGYPYWNVTNSQLWYIVFVNQNNRWTNHRIAGSSRRHNADETPL